MKTNRTLIILISLSVINKIDAAQAARNAFQRLGQAGRQLMNQGQALKEAAQPGYQAAREAAQSGIQTASEAMAPMKEGLQSVGKELGEGLGNGGWWQQVKDVMPGLRKERREFMRNAFEAAAKRTEQFGTNLQQTGRTVQQELANQFKPGKEIAEKYMQKQMTGRSATDYLDAGNKALRKTIDTTQSFAKDFGHGLRQQLQGAQDSLSSDLQSIRTKLGNVKSGLGSGLQNTGNSLTSTAQSYGSSLRDRLDNLRTQLSELTPYSWGAQTPVRAYEFARPSGFTLSDQFQPITNPVALNGARQDAIDQSVLNLGRGYDGDLSTSIDGEYPSLRLSPNDLFTEIVEEQAVLAAKQAILDAEQQKLDELARFATNLKTTQQEK